MTKQVILPTPLSHHDIHKHDGFPTNGWAAKLEHKKKPTVWQRIKSLLVWVLGVI